MKHLMLCRECNLIFKCSKKDIIYRINYKKSMWYHYIKCPICGNENKFHKTKFLKKVKGQDIEISVKGTKYLKD